MSARQGRPSCSPGAGQPLAQQQSLGRLPCPHSGSWREDRLQKRVLRGVFLNKHFLKDTKACAPQTAHRHPRWRGHRPGHATLDGHLTPLGLSQHGRSGSGRDQLLPDAHLQADEDEGDARPVEVLHQLAEPQRHGGVDAADSAALQDGGARGRCCGDRRGGSQWAEVALARGPKTGAAVPLRGTASPSLPEHQPPGGGASPHGPTSGKCHPWSWLCGESQRPLE